MKSFGTFVDEEKAYYSNDSYDKENFPGVDREFMQYSKASRATLKELCAKRKLDTRGSKKQLITRILQSSSGREKVSGYYNKMKHTGFAQVKAKEKAKGDADE